MVAAVSDNPLDNSLDNLTDNLSGNSMDNSLGNPTLLDLGDGTGNLIPSGLRMDHPHCKSCFWGSNPET